MTRDVAGIAAALVALLVSAAPARAQSGSIEIALVANSADATVALVNVATRSIVGRIDINPARVKASGPGAPNYAQDTDVSPDGTTMYVSRGYIGDVAAFDIATGKLLWNRSLNTGRADHMTLTPDGRSLFVSAMLDNRVYRIETATGKITGHIVTGVYPHDNKVSRDGKLLYNTSIGALATLPRSPKAPPLTETPGAPFQLTIVDVSTLETRDRVRIDYAIRPWQFAPDEKGLYAQLANQHAVVYYDLATREFTRRLGLPIKSGITPADYDFDAPHHGLALTEDGNTLCLAGRASDYVALVSAPELKLITTIPVGDAPGWTETADNGNVCLVANSRSDDLSIISIPERKEVVRLPIGDGPKHITIARIPESVIDAVTMQGRPRTDAAAVRNELEQVYQRNTDAFLSYDVAAVMALRAPDFHTVAADGTTRDRAAMETYTVGILNGVKKWNRISFTIDSLRVSGDTAFAIVSQYLDRMGLRPDNAVHHVETWVTQREIWIRTRGGWLLWQVDQLRNQRRLVDGQPG